MRLIDPSVIRTDLGFDDMPDINSAVEGSLDAATPILASFLDTDFTQGMLTEVFAVPRQDGGHARRRFVFSDQGGPAGNDRATQFRLSRGFVRDVVASYGSRLACLGTPSAVDISAVMGGADALEVGVMRDFTTCYAGGFVRFTYSYGFPVSPDDPNMFDPTFVPDWLQRAAYLRAMIMLKGTAALEEAKIEIDTKILSAEYQALIARKRRYAPLSLSPL